MRVWIRFFFFINTKIISPIIGLLLGDTDLSESLVTVLKTGVDAETVDAGTDAGSENSASLETPTEDAGKKSKKKKKKEDKK